jgi:hypothetical protein
MQVNTMAIAKSSEEARIRYAKGLFLTAAAMSFFLSIYLWFSGDRQGGLYVGLWVPSICSAGSIILYKGRSHE